jgi:uncharacterized delta-60 repeat protein
MRVLFLVPLISLNLYSQYSDLQVKWENNYPITDNSSYSLGNYIKEDISNTVLDSKGNIYIVTNNSDVPPYYKKIRITKFSKTGIRLWNIEQTDSVYPNIEAGAINVDKEDNIHIAGYAYSYKYYSGKADLIYLKYNHEGKLEWKRQYGNVNPYPYSFNIPKSIQFDFQKNAIISGVVGQFIPDDNIFSEDSMMIVKYNTQGELLWVAESRPDTVFIYDPAGVQLDDSGNVFVACSHYWYTPNKGHYDYMLIKYNSQGKYEWHRIYDYSDYYEKPFDLAIDSRGNSYIAGYYTYPYNITKNYEWLTLSYDRHGKLRTGLYRDLTYGDYYEYAGLVRIDHHDNVFIAGQRYTQGKYHFAIDKYDSSGIFLWEKLFDLKFNSASDLFINQDNSIVFAAVDDSLEQHVIVLDQNGDIQWKTDLTGPVNNYYAPINLTGFPDEGLLITSAGSDDISDVQLNLYNKSGDTIWNVSTKDYGMHQLKKIITTPAGEVFAVGQIDNGRDDYDFATIKYSPSGLALWGNRYEGPAGMQDIPEDMSLDRMGNVFVTGSSKGSGTGYDYVTIKYDSSGMEQWLARYNGPAFLSDEGHYVKVDHAGNVYITGNSLNNDGNYDIATVKYNPAGQFQWVKRYAGAVGGFDGVCGLELDKQGDIYVGGTSDSIGALYDFLLIKYDPDGQLKWTRRYNGPGNDGDMAQAMAIDKDDNLYLTGWSVGDGTEVDYAVLKYAPSGRLEWAARWDDPASSSEEADAVAVDGDGNVFITGFSPGAGTGNDITTVKFNKSGEYQWFVTYDGGTGENDDGWCIGLDVHGDIYVSGSVNNDDKMDIIKYNPEGIFQWKESYRYGDFKHLPTDLIVDKTGNIFLGGNSGDDEVSYWNIVKYNQNGFIPTAIKDHPASRSEFFLLQVYPNPSGSSTVVSYSLPESGYVTIEVYNMLGVPVKNLVSEHEAPGEYHLTFSPGNLPGGVLFVQMKIGGKLVETQKIILLK